MSELIDRQALLDECLNHYEVGNIEQNCTMDWICKTVRNFPAASPWHRVEEPPKEVGCYLVVGFDRHWFYDIAEYFPIDNEWVMNENQPDSTYIRYWMPLPEPPKEE